MIYLCEKCGECFQDQVSFSHHHELHGKDETNQNLSILKTAYLENDQDINKLMVEETCKNLENENTYVCEICAESFHDEWLLIAHKDLVHEDVRSEEKEDDCFVCNICKESYNDELLLIAHNELFHCKIGQELFGGNIANTSTSSSRNETETEENCDQNRKNLVNQPNSTPIEIFAEAMTGPVVRHYKIKNASNQDLEKFLEVSKSIIVNTLKTEVIRLNCIKFNLLLDATFTNVENEVSLRGFIARSRSIIRTSDLESVVEECLQELILKLTEHEGRGSGWSLLNVGSMDVRVHKQGYGERGGSYIPLPEKILRTNSCINVQNEDNECFRYAMLVKHVHDHNSYRPSKKYQDVSHKYNFNGISYPVSLQDINIFEKFNLGVSVNVYGITKSSVIYPLRISPRETNDHTDLLLLKEGDVSHYVYIKNFTRLVIGQLRRRNKHNITVCKRCLCHSSKAPNKGGIVWLKEHLRLCGQKPSARVVLPTKDRANIKFEKTNHQYRIPITIYADFEASLLSTDDDEQLRSENTTRLKYQKHEPNSYCMLLKSSLGKEFLRKHGLPEQPRVYRGENVAKTFVDELYSIAKKVEDIYTTTVPMIPLDDIQTLNHNSATMCYLCKEEFQVSNIKTRDHDHLTGKYRGPACNSCNLNYKVPKFIPVVLHNLSKYDAHFIIPELGRDKGAIDVLATTCETFISFSKRVGKIKLRFLDSFRFMPSSLLKLTENLQDENMIETKEIVPKDKLNLVLRKGVFPYDYIDSCKKFDETSLPSIDHFYSKLNESPISSEDYEHARKVWSELKMKSLGEYSDFYVKLDVTLLCDVMEEFRNTCIKAYGLDPLHSYTAPGLAWQAMLKETKCNLELLTDIDMLLMVESAVRGGITQSVTRHVKANNKYLPDYDSSEESVYLGYFDANNLYGWAMSQVLPYGGFKWVKPEDLGDILKIPKNGEFGYLLDCDFEYPETLHDQHYDFPLLPKSEVPPGKKFPKLMTTLENKKRYVAHYWVVQQAIQMGLRIKNVHRVLRFSQSSWLEPYIASNTARRAAARSAFEKEFYKLMNNAIFGKTLQNNRKHKNIKLVSDKKRLEKLISKPTFNTSIVINESLVAVSMDNSVIKMDKPIYIGVSILDISKTLMYDFHYNKMVDYYGRDRIGIAYMDTDAFIYFIKTDDLYEDLKTFPYKYDFDFSDYPPDHPTYDNGVNKKVLGKFKDETNSKVVAEIVALAAKMYALELLLPSDRENLDSKCIKKAKGIKNIFLKKKIAFNHYKTCLFENKTYSATYNTIRSFNHQLFSIRETKTSLTPYDDKRKILQDNIHSLPYGHYSLKNISD